MNAAFKKRLKRLLFWMLLLFVILFIFRLIYGYVKVIDDASNSSQFIENVSNTRRNYASKKYEVRATSSGQVSTTVDQKYEKIAEIKSKTADFVKEEKTARTTIDKFEALIQFEQKSGNAGDRKLSLIIGVPPENFDALYDQLIKIGNVQAKQIIKKDKTNEYKELNAKKESLEKIRTSLIELKSKGGRIDEYMDLENRVLEIEQELQGLGVSLGDFDDENEFCTVQFSLSEGKEVKIGVMQRVKVALEWTIKQYLKIITLLVLITVFAYLVLLVVDKFKILEQVMGRKE